MKPTSSDPRCTAVRDLFQTIGSKWASLVVIRLSESPKRFSELKREISGVTQKSLTTTLRRLERDGIVERAVTASLPPRVDYQLTELGETLIAPLTELMDWAVIHHSEVKAARDRTDGV